MWGRGLLEIHFSQIMHLPLLAFSKWVIVLSLLRINRLNLSMMNYQHETAPMVNS